ncbi:hypothetical protein [Prescottella sp. R16]|uniref:hypothetical protein n=1 Tax=Prescottella sp. R16 TaxID=3064529 RepID=UPI00272E2D07|nr:hypothetical protein [Prescottella sp. R16]
MESGAADAAEFVRRIDLLDGLTCTLVARQFGVWEVMVGGGPDCFVVTATSADRVANAVTGGRSEAGTVDLTVGGQAVDYPVQYVLTRDEVAHALADVAAGTFPAGRWET